MNQNQFLKHCPVLLGIILCTGCFASGFEPRSSSCDVYDEFSDNKKMLAIGDSVFAFRLSTCETVPDIAATKLGWKLRHKAVNGARITGGDYPIVDQYEAGDWDWVLLDGGGNDLKQECQCDEGCDAVLDKLISEDGKSGEIPTLVNKIRGDGANVAVYGYFRIDDRAFYDFDKCIDELDVLHRRQKKMAALHRDVIFVDGRTVVSPESTPGAYAFDYVHPSAQGARIVGKLIAQSIERADRFTP